MTEIDDLVATVRAGLDDDEQTARLAAEDARGMGIAHDEPARWRNSDGNVYLDGGYGSGIAVGGYGSAIGDAVADHMARHDPHRVLAEVASKRVLVDKLLAEKHVTCEDSWYSCSAANVSTGDRDNDEPCDCGRDERVHAYLQHLARPYQEKP